MKIITTADARFGPYASVETLADRYVCDGSVLPFNVLGDATVEDYVATIAPATPEVKAAKNAEINAWREKANFTTFPYGGKLIACDTLSRSDIDAVAGHIALFGTLPSGFPGGWKATDNATIFPMGITEFKEMYTAMTTQGTANFIRAQARKAELAAATTAAEVDAIVW